MFSFRVLTTLSGTGSTDYVLPNLYEASIAELRYGLDNGYFTSVDLVKVKFLSIDHLNALLNPIRPISRELMK
jgi:amidase